MSKQTFFDETSASTDMIRRYGRALAGARSKDAASAGHWQMLTFIANQQLQRIVM